MYIVFGVWFSVVRFVVSALFVLARLVLCIIPLLLCFVRGRIFGGIVKQVICHFTSYLDEFLDIVCFIGPAMDWQESVAQWWDVSGATSESCGLPVLGLLFAEH